MLDEKGYTRGSVIEAYCVCLGARHGGFRNVTALCSLKDLLNSKQGGGVTVLHPIQQHVNLRFACSEKST